MAAPDGYIEWINSHLGFNPRAQQNSNALSDLVTTDLVQEKSLLGMAIGSGNLFPKKNAEVLAHFASRNIDLVFDESRTPDLSIPVSVENKTIMAAHGKARKNRYGDLIAYCNHMHNHRKDCVVGGIVVINVSEDYLNPDTFAKDMKRRKVKMEEVVKKTIGIFAAIPLRDTPDDLIGIPEALAVIAVDYDGVNPGNLVTDERAPQPGNPIYYGDFLTRLCALYEKRHQ